MCFALRPLSYLINYCPGTSSVCLLKWGVPTSRNVNVVSPPVVVNILRNSPFVRLGAPAGPERTTAGIPTALYSSPATLIVLSLQHLSRWSYITHLQGTTCFPVSRFVVTSEGTTSGSTGRHVLFSFVHAMVGTMHYGVLRTWPQLHSVVTTRRGHATPPIARQDDCCVVYPCRKANQQLWCAPCSPMVHTGLSMTEFTP